MCVACCCGLKAQIHAERALHEAVKQNTKHYVIDYLFYSIPVGDVVSECLELFISLFGVLRVELLCGC